MLLTFWLTLSCFSKYMLFFVQRIRLAVNLDELNDLEELACPALHVLELDKFAHTMSTSEILFEIMVCIRVFSWLAL